MNGFLWMLLGLLGLFGLAAAMYYGQFKTTHPAHTRREDRHLDKATREIYEEVEHERQQDGRT